jgi:ABC-2 type transport system permease protein
MTYRDAESPRIRWADVLRAEVTKIITYPTTVLAVVVVFSLNTAFGVLIATDAVRIAAGDRIVRLGDLGGVLLTPAYAFVLIAVFAAGTEYQGGQLRVTLAAVPGRARLLAGKLSALLIVVVPAAVVCVLPGRLIAASGGQPPSSPGSLVAALSGWVMVYTALSIIAFGLGVLMKSVVAPVALLTLVPLLAWTGVFQLPEVVRMLPHDASLSLLGTPTSPATTLTPGVAGAVLVLWCLAAALAACIALARRDS